jgi:hypothetical protein
MPLTIEYHGAGSGLRWEAAEDSAAARLRGLTTGGLSHDRSGRAGSCDRRLAHPRGISGVLSSPHRRFQYAAREAVFSLTAFAQRASDHYTAGRNQVALDEETASEWGYQGPADAASSAGGAPLAT